MKDSVKIVLIGAGSREFAKGLIQDIVLEKILTENRDVHVVLVDIDENSLAAMLGYAERCAAATGSRIRFSSTTRRREALAGADFVLLSIAIKRMELWEQDFRIPLAYGIPHVYGENGGPGAAFHALRNLKMILPICRDMEELCPDAWLINFTNPEARVLTAVLTLTKVKALGLCHGFYSFRRLAGATLGRPLEELDIRTAGINHLYTYYRIADAATGEDLAPEFERRLRADPSALPPLVKYVWDTFGALGYISETHIGEYFGFAHEFMGKLWKFGIESRVVQPGERGVDGRTCFEAWRRRMDVPTFLASGVEEAEARAFAGPVDPLSLKSSGELAVPVISDMVLDRKRWRESVNVLNGDRFIENLDDDTSVELPAVVDAAGVHPERVGRLGEGFAAVVRQQQAVQRLLVQALRDGSRKTLLQALLMDPLVHTSARDVEAMLDHFLMVQKEYLPEFK